MANRHQQKYRRSSLKQFYLIVFGACFLGAFPAAQAQTASPEAADTDLPRQRAEWFYEQRAYPLGFIPAGVRLEALKEMDRMVALEPSLAGRQSGAVSAPSSASALALQAPSATQWTSIGPQPTVTPFDFPTVSGRVTALAVNPRNASVVYLGAAQGGVWKTFDGGQNWTPLTDTQLSLAVGSLVLDPSNPDIVYVGTGEQNFSIDSYYGAGILKSTDGGVSWVNLGSRTFAGPFGRSTGGATIGALAVHPSNGQILLAGAQTSGSTGSAAGIFRSTDGGVNWTNVLPGAPGTDVLFDPSDGRNAYAALGSPSGGSLNGVYKSTDAGLTWALAGGAPGSGNTLPTANLGRIALAISPANPSVLYSAIQNVADGSLLGLFKTSDGTFTWTPLLATPSYCSPQCWYDNVIKVHPTNPLLLFAGGSAASAASNGFPSTLFRSLDQGMGWTEISAGVTGQTLHPDVHALAFSADGKKLYVATDGGVWSTIDITDAAVGWTNLNTTLAITQFYPGFSIQPANVNVALTGTQDNGVQRYIGTAQAPWVWVICDDAGWTAHDPIFSGTVYAACSRIQIMRSVLNGDVNSWSSAQTGINPADRVAFLPPLVIDASRTLYFGTFRVYQSVDGAGSWTAISPDLTRGGSISTLAVAPSNTNTVYAGTSDSRVQVTTNARAGTGATWTDRSTGLPQRFITQIAVNPTNAQTAYVTFSGFSGFGDSGHVFRTTDGGASWTDVSGNLPNIPVNDIAVDPDVPTALYVATDIGVFSTSNGGTTWAPLGSGLPRVAVLGLRLHRASRILRAATHGRSMFDLPVPVPPPNPVPAANSLSPSSAPFGGAGFTLTVNGSNFVSNSVVRWNGSDRSTTFAGSTQLTASIPAGDIATAGTAQVTVFNPAPGGGASNALTFTINAPNPVPSLTLLAPSSAAAGRAAFTLTVYGSNFVTPSVVRWNGSDRTTTFVSSTQLTAAIPASDIATAGTAQVTVFTVGGGASNARPFTIAGAATSIPVIPANGTVSAASLQAGSGLAAGGIAAIFGSNLATLVQDAPGVPLPLTLGGATLLFNGNVTAPLFFASPGQVNIQIPWELTGQTQASLTDTVNDTTGNPATVALAQFSPGIFTSNSSGAGQGEILIAGTATVAAPTGSLGGRDARPVKRGDESIAIFATGLGDVTNRPGSGLSAPSQAPLAETLTKPTVTIGGVPADVTFSGLAPFFVGLYQVNAQVPANAPTGDAVEVVVTIGGIGSNRVTIAVQ